MKPPRARMESSAVLDVRPPQIRKPFRRSSFRRAGAVAGVLLLGFWVAGCEDGASSSPDAQKLRVVSLGVAGRTLETEVAATPEQQQRGLMFRDHLPQNRAMIFPFEAPRQASFWMRNTRIPLSIAYLDARGTILEIHDMQPHDERSVQSRSQAVSYALEVNQGWFRRHGIVPGDRVLGLEAVRGGG